MLIDYVTEGKNGKPCWQAGLCAYYVTARRGGHSIGRPLPSIDRALELCSKYHAEGYRYLRIYSYGSGKEYAYRKGDERKLKCK